jgi:hypothetical protein
MKFYVEWQFFLAVASQEKCAKLVDKISGVLGVNLNEVKSERYWKESAVYTVGAQSSFEAANPKDALDAIMKTIKSLAPTWIVTVPSDDDSWEFAGRSNPGAIHLSGVNSVSFSVLTVKNTGLAEAV